MDRDPKDTSSGMQPTIALKFPVMDVKFNETLFPAKEVTNSRASMNDPPISESDNESDTSGLEIVIPAQSSPRPPNPGQSALRSRSQTQTHLNPPIVPPAVPPGAQPSGSGLPPA